MPPQTGILMGPSTLYAQPRKPLDLRSQSRVLITKPRKSINTMLRKSLNADATQEHQCRCYSRASMLSRRGHTRPASSPNTAETGPLNDLWDIAN
ncbi:uncharacterized protein SCHCODRAFT_02705938 [Schizophyllum commune H4-8]|nr:uncharacterized protein SCHCODRAFT_02705938 [Schizophyllum commune H4-8]KAI5886340.1 hypothetical protein SCHCODRAFT_02705938 [Schizophyllum commune H4-8]